MSDDYGDHIPEFRVIAAKCSARIFQGLGNDVTGSRVLAMMILMEAWLTEGGDAAAARLGWEIGEKQPASLVEVKEAMLRGEWPS